jgi:hypothetical protein
MTDIIFTGPTPPPITRSTGGRGLITMQFLLAASKLLVGDELNWTERGRTHRAFVQADGRLLINGHLANTPSEAGKIAHGARRPAGWDVWISVRDGRSLADKRREIGREPS